MIARRKKSVDGVRQKRQSSRINNLPNPMINSTISPEIMNTISTLNAPSLANGKLVDILRIVVLAKKDGCIRQRYYLN